MVKPLAEVTVEDYDDLFRTNLKGPLFAIKRAGEVLRDNGRIVTVSTLNTSFPVPGIALYAGSKGALEQVTKVAAREFGARGITANVVSPGATDTDMFRAANPPEAAELLVGLTALGRVGVPADVADVVAFLAGPDSHWLTGQTLRASGGLLI